MSSVVRNCQKVSSKDKVNMFTCQGYFSKVTELPTSEWVIVGKKTTMSSQNNLKNYYERDFDFQTIVMHCEGTHMKLFLQKTALSLV